MINLDDVLNYITLASWILLLVYIAVFFVRSLLRDGIALALLYLVSARVLFPLLLVVAISLTSASIVFIDPTRVAVVISFIAPGGVRPLPMSAGFHLLFPIIEQEIKYPVAWQTYTLSGTPNEGAVMGDDSISARTSDGQEVRIDCSIVFRINPAQVVTLHIDWQSRYVEEFVRPVIQGFVRGQVSQFRASEVNSSVRQDLETALERALRTEFAAKGLLVDRFLLRNISFTEQYANAVEEKQVALEGQARTEYEAQQKRNLATGERDRIVLEAEGRSQQLELEGKGRAAARVLEAEAQAKAVLLEAEAQAQALRLLGSALLENPDLLTYEYINKLSPNIRVMLVPNNAPLILPLPELNDPLTATAALTATTVVTEALPAQSPAVTATQSMLPVLPPLRDEGSGR